MLVPSMAWKTLKSFRAKASYSVPFELKSSSYAFVSWVAASPATTSDLPQVRMAAFVEECN